MSDTLTIYLSGDAWNGNAAANLTVNGRAVGGTLDVAAVNATDSMQAFTFTGDFGPAPVVAVSFINDAWNGNPAQDRNLYLDGFSYDGVPQLGFKKALTYDQTVSYKLVSAPATAERASDFLSAIGVDVHLDYWDTSYGLGNGQWGGNTSRVASSLAYLGVNRIRVGLPTAGTLPEMQVLAAKGMTFDVLMPSTSSDAALKGQLAALYPIAGAVVAIEGPNEANLTSDFSWNGQKDYAAAAAYQKALYAAVKADPTLKNTAVYAPTLGGVGADAYAALGDLSAAATYGNVHVYYPNGTPPASTLQYGLGLAAAATHSDPVVITETNYTSAPAIAGSVSVDVQARYDLDLLMDATQMGVQATYFYELLDEHADPQQSYNENHFGLFNADGTPKPAATALHNLASILADGGAAAASFKAGRLAYSVSGLPASGNSLVLEKSNGAYDFVLWAEPKIWDAAGKNQILAATRQAVVSLAVPGSQALVFDPLLGTAPVATYGGVSSISVPVTDHPVIVEIEPATAPVNQTTLGAGPDRLTLAMSEDAFQGDAQFTVAVDGKQAGGTQPVTASHGKGESQAFDVLGAFRSGSHSVSITFLNDLYSPGVGDRNLFLGGATIGGAAVPGAHLSFWSAGTQSFSFVAAPTS